MSERDQIAKEIKEKHAAANVSEKAEQLEDELNSVVSDALSEYEQEEDESEVMGVDFDDEEDDETAVIADSPVSDFPAGEGEADSSTDDGEEEGDDILLADSPSNIAQLTDDYELTDEMIFAEFRKVPKEEVTQSVIDDIRKEVLQYRQKLLIKSGLTTDEADDLAQAKLKKLTNLEDIKWLQDHPDALNIVIDKERADKLEFTDEERKKMQKVDVIRLKVVEEKELKTYKIKKMNQKNKTAYLDRMDSGLATYSVPLPMTNDFIKFRGAQLVQLAQAVEYEDSTMDDVTNRKASLIYKLMINGTRLHKTDENGKPVMSYSDFINNFMYHDLDMGIFGILAASSVEEMETTLSCPDCGNDYPFKYNMKSLLSTDNLSKEFKQQFEDILAHKSDEEFLKKLNDDTNKTTVVESPITNNVYFISRPTVARAIEVFRRINQDDPIDTYYSALMMFFEKILLPDELSEEKIEIEGKEIGNMRKVLQELPDEEL